MIESLESDTFSEAYIREAVEASAADYARVIDQLKAYIPNPNAAAESGL